MIVVHHATAGALLERAGVQLEAREPENVLLLGICTSHASGSGEPGQHWLGVEDGGGVVGAAVCTTPYDLTLSFRPGDAVLDALVADLRAHGVRLPGVIGEEAVAAAFADRWSRGGPRAEVSMRQGVYTLRRVVPPSPTVPGALRLAEQHDVALVVEWTNAFADEALLPANHREAFVRSWAALVGRGEQFLWEAGGRPVSMAALRGWTRHGVRIAAVYTPPEARGHGYARACVAALSAHVLASGRRFCSLLTDMANPTSNRVYQSVGYEKLYESLRYAFA